MAALEQRRGDDATLELPEHGIEWMIRERILTPTAFHVAKVVKLTERSAEDDLTQVPEFIQWAHLGSMLGVISAAVKWWIGDWLAFGEGAWGERYAQAADETGLDIGTLQNYAYVCRQILPSRRRDELSWSAHLRVAKLEPTEQEAWLEHAVEYELHSKELGSAIREHGTSPPAEGNGVPDLETLPHRATEIDPDRVLVIARKVWRDAVSDGNGSYLIPAGTFKLLASALGKDHHG